MEKNKEQSQKTEIKQTYLNRETLEILTDPLEISYYKSLQQDEIVKSNLLGEFDNVGNYNINKDILIELVSGRKYIKESQDDKYVLKMPIKEGFNDLMFTLQISQEADKKTAILRLIETYTRYNGIKEIFKTIVARYKDDADIYFFLKIKKLFNIVDVDESEGKDIKNEEFLKIILKKFQDFKLLETQDPIFDNMAKEYIDNIISILEKNPSKNSKYILRHYSLLVNELKGFSGKPGFNRLLKIKLDKIIDDTNKKIKDFVLEPLIIEARNVFLTKKKEAQKNILEPKQELQAKVETKKEEKPKVKTAEKPEESKKDSKSKPKSKPKKKENKNKDKDKKKTQQPFKFFNFGDANQENKKESQPTQSKNQNTEKIDLTIDTGVLLVVSNVKPKEKEKSVFMHRVEKSSVYKKNNQQELTI